MKNYIIQIDKRLKTTREILLIDSILRNDIDFSLSFIPPFSSADKLSDIKLVFIGQDPTVEKEESRAKINVTLNLDKENGIKTYLKKICETLEIDLNKEVYATNLYKCFFKKTPYSDKTILNRHFKVWMDLLINELSVFENAIFISLGQPTIEQLFHSKSKELKYYWDHIGSNISGKNFKCNEPYENYLQKRIYPIAHQPTWMWKSFYKMYLNDYLEYIKENERKAR
jgi:uracil-DNA glycosylase